MSKHVHTGHTKAHAPQPRHRSDCSCHTGLSKAPSSLALTSSALNSTLTSARWACLSIPSARAAPASPSPLGVSTSTSAPPPSVSVVTRMSLPSVPPGLPPTDVQKQQSSHVLQLKATIVVWLRRASNMASS